MGAEEGAGHLWVPKASAEGGGIQKTCSRAGRPTGRQGDRPAESTELAERGGCFEHQSQRGGGKVSRGCLGPAFQQGGCAAAAAWLHVAVWAPQTNRAGAR